MKIFDFSSITLKKILRGTAVIVIIFIFLFSRDKIYLYDILFSLVFSYYTICWMRIE